MSWARVAIIALCACSEVRGVEQTTEGLGGDVIDLVSPLCGLVDYSCDGRVFLCDRTSVDGVTDAAELCWVDDSSSELTSAIEGAGYVDVSCEPTPRGGALGWPCHYQCPGAKGCNAYQSCWCE